MPNSHTLEPKCPQSANTERKPRAIDELRALLTSACNFRCGFCHHEGVQTVAHPATTPAWRWMEMLLEAVRSGCRDITLSGGEPMLAPVLVKGILSGLASSSTTDRPDITIITNGSRLDEDVLRAMTWYPGQLMPNLSWPLNTPGDRLAAEIKGQALIRRQSIQFGDGSPMDVAQTIRRAP